MKVLAYPEECPLANEVEEASTNEAIPFALLAPLVAEGIKALIGLGVDYLKAQEDKYDATTGPIWTAGTMYASSGTNSNYTLQTHCIIVVKGEFGEAASTAPATTKLLPNQPAWDWSAEELKLLHLVKAPDLYLELRPVVYGSGMALQPVFLDYRKAGTKLTSSEQKKDLLLLAEFSAPTTVQTAAGVIQTSAPEGVYARYLLLLNKVKIGSRLDAKTLDGIDTNLEPLVPVKSGDQTTLGGFGLKVTLTETEDAGKFLTALGKKIEEQTDKLSTDTLSKAITDWITKITTKSEKPAAG